MGAHVTRAPLGVLARGRLAAGRAGQVIAGLCIAAAAAAATWFVVSRGSIAAVGALGLAAAVLWLATTRRTQLALALFMIYLGALDGFLKLSSGSSVVTLVRDVLLFAIVAGLLVRAQVEGRRLAAPPLTAWVAAFVVLVLVQMANPHDGTVMHSLGGVRQQLEFVPLFFLTYAFVRTTRALRVFVILVLLLAAANGAVNWVQFHLTPQQLAAWGPGYADRVLAQGEFSASGRSFYDTQGNNYVRPFGLGSEAGAGGLVGAFALAGIIALCSLFTRLRYLLFAVAMAIAAVTAIVTSQGRGVVVASFVIVLVYGLLTATSRGRIGGLIGIGVAGLVGLIVTQAITVGAGGSANFRYRGLTASSIVQTTDQARGRSLARIPATVATYPLGAGLAVAGPASGSPGATALAGTVDAENEFSFMTLETGIAGALLMTAFTIMLLTLALLRCRREPDREARVMLAAIVAPLAGVLALYVSSAPTSTTPAGPYLWATAGIVAYWLITRPRERAHGATG